MQKIIEKLKEIVGSANCLTENSDTIKYVTGWRYPKEPGKALCVVRPDSYDKISRILRVCNENNVYTLMQGGNTGMVGSSVPDESGSTVVISAELLNNILDSNKKSMTVTVQSGVILEKLNSYLAKDNLWFPIDIGSVGSAQVGGCIATNAAGSRRAYYGSCGDRVLSLKIALRDGNIIDIKRKEMLIQDNSRIIRIDPIDLFIGSQGIFGYILEASLLAEAIPEYTVTALLKPSSLENIDNIHDYFLYEFEGELTAFEFLSDNIRKCIRKRMKCKDSFEGDAVLIEIASDDKNLESNLQKAISTLYNDGYISDVVIHNNLWDERHFASEAYSLELKDKKMTPVANDISLPEGRFIPFKQKIIKDITKKFHYLKVELYDFGHYSFNACHMNFGVSTSDEKILDEFKEFFREEVIKQNGSISAEHGVGPYNNESIFSHMNTGEKIIINNFIRGFGGSMNPHLRVVK